MIAQPNAVPRNVRPWQAVLSTAEYAKHAEHAAKTYRGACRRRRRGFPQYYPSGTRAIRTSGPTLRALRVSPAAIQFRLRALLPLLCNRDASLLSYGCRRHLLRGGLLFGILFAHFSYCCRLLKTVFGKVLSGRLRFRPIGIAKYVGQCAHLCKLDAGKI